MSSSLDSLAVLFPYAASSGEVTVRVAVSFLAEQSDQSAGRWFWSYHIRIENRGKRSVQLLSRHWHIRDGRGDVHEVIGDGVVGEMPLIAPGASFDYVSGCPLSTPTGSMADNFSLTECARFDPKTGKWSAIAPLPVLMVPVRTTSAAVMVTVLSVTATAEPALSCE